MPLFFVGGWQLWKLFAMQFVGTMPAMIEIAGLLSAVLGSWLDFWIIFALLMTNATLGFVEEMNPQASISALKDGMIRKLPVKRDGKFTPMDVAEIVPCDVVFLRGGNVIPADGKWLDGDELAVDQAALTGESLPVQVPREDSEGEPGSGKKLWSGAIVKTGECEVTTTRRRAFFSSRKPRTQPPSDTYTPLLPLSLPLCRPL